MLIPLSWLKDYVDIDIPAEVLAERLTLAGLEVGKLYYIGVPQTERARLHTHFKDLRVPPSEHLVWDRERILLGAIREVHPHPNADRLVIAVVDYGGAEPERCVTGAPNLFDYKGQGTLEPPLWTAFAAEGAEVWDGHSDTPKRMILKGKELRGVYNRSMVCSDKELGISDEHEGVILLHEQPLNHVTGEPAAPGTPLQDVLGDVLLDIELTPNLARAYSVLGVAREVAALLDKDLREPSYDLHMTGTPIEGTVKIDIREPELNPRFTLTLLRNVAIKPSPEWMQRRLRLVGQRPINNIVDVTNYITFEIGQPLHAFDYDKLLARAKAAGDSVPTIITRLPAPGEMLETLDEVQRELQPHNILVCDTAGVLSMGGIIGGAETEISASTTSVLLEAANWNFINIRRTMQSQKVFTDAGTRFSRGVHPSQALLGVKRGAELMRQFSGAEVAQGVLDEYPTPPQQISVELPAREIERLLGVAITVEEAADILARLQFEVAITADALRVVAPPYRTDISSDAAVGQADLIEEIARVYGYDRLPDSIMADAMPPQHSNIPLEREERCRDVLVALGLRENISYRFTTPEREALLTPPGQPNSLPDAGYVTLANPISVDKTVLRRTLLVNLLENAANNVRYQERQRVFEIGSVYLVHDGQTLPHEPRHLGLLLTGTRRPIPWANDDPAGQVDFYDLKGVVEGLLDGLHIAGARYTRAQHSSFHPGRSAQLSIGETLIGTFGELHPLVTQAFDLGGTPVFAAEFDLDTLLGFINPLYSVKPLPNTPPVYQDIALVVRQDLPAAEVEAVIVQAGGAMLKAARLFDVYQGEPIPAGYKSLAYALTYQMDDQTLTDKDVAGVHKKIVKAAEARLGATLRG